MKGDNMKQNEAWRAGVESTHNNRGGGGGGGGQQHSLSDSNHRRLALASYCL